MGDIAFSAEGSGTANGRATAVSTPLEVGDTVTIDGSSDLSSCVVGGSNACVFSISLEEGDVYEWAIGIDAQGPEGIGSGSLNLTFVDGTQDAYKIEILSSSRKHHSLEYDSTMPGITQFSWSP
jgi:hypothetical protein